MTQEDKEFIKSTQNWIRTKIHDISFNELLIEQTKQQIEHLKNKVELERSELELNKQSLKTVEDNLREFMCNLLDG